jgi:hypothetical protein
VSTPAIGRPLPKLSALDSAGQAAVGLAVAAAAAGLTAFATTRATLSGIAAVLVVAGSLWLATTRRTLLALALVMVYLGALDGYLKLATGSTYVTFVRDALLYALIIGLLVRATVRHQEFALPPLSGWVIAFVVVVLIQLANPQDGTLVHSLAGVRQHLEFVPIFFLTFAFVRTKRALRAFVILLALIAAANGIVGWVQFKESPQQFASWGPGYAQRVLGTGQFALAGRTFGQAPGQSSNRPFGLGSDSGSGGVIAAFAVAGILALAIRARRGRYLVFAAIMALAATVAIITSQSRNVLVGAFVILLVFGLLTATSRGRLRVLVSLGVAGLVSFAIVQGVVSSSGPSALRYGGLGPSSILQTADNARGRSLARIPNNLASYPLGAGLATAGPASGSAPGGTSLVGSVDAENEFSFLIVEAGIPGVVVLTAFLLRLLYLGFRRCKQEPDRETRLLLAGVIAPVAGILVLFLSSALTPTEPAGPYQWAAAGIISYWLIQRPADLRAGSTSAPRPGEREPAPAPVGVR